MGRIKHGELAVVAHRLKGAASIMKNTRLEKIAAYLESIARNAPDELHQVVVQSVWIEVERYLCTRGNRSMVNMTTRVISLSAPRVAKIPVVKLPTSTN